MATIKAKRGSTGRRSAATSAAKPATKKAAPKKTGNTPYTKKGGGYGKGGPITSVSKYYSGHTVVVQNYKNGRR